MFLQNQSWKALTKKCVLEHFGRKIGCRSTKDFTCLVCFSCWSLPHRLKKKLSKFKVELNTKRLVVVKKKTLEVTIVVYCCCVLEGVDVVFILNFSSSYVLTSIKINRSKKVVRRN